MPEPPVERLPPRPVPTYEAEEETHDPEHAAATADGGKRALVQYDYEKAEDNAIELKEGDYVTNIEMVDDDWWMGTDSIGETGLFPSNYVEVVEEDHAAGPSSHAVRPPPLPAAEPEPAAHAEATTAGGATATVQFDYEAAEDNGTQPMGSIAKDD